MAVVAISLQPTKGEINGTGALAEVEAIHELGEGGTEGDFSTSVETEG